MIVTNKIYHLEYSLGYDYVYLEQLFIKPKYRNRGYTIRIIRNLMKTTNQNELRLLCYPNLIKFYEHIGLTLWSRSLNGNGLVEMYINN